MSSRHWKVSVGKPYGNYITVNYHIENDSRSFDNPSARHLTTFLSHNLTDFKHHEHQIAEESKGHQQSSYFQIHANFVLNTLKIFCLN